MLRSVDTRFFRSSDFTESKASSSKSLVTLSKLFGFQQRIRCVSCGFLVWLLLQDPRENREFSDDDTIIVCFGFPKIMDTQSYMRVYGICTLKETYMAMVLARPVIRSALGWCMLMYLLYMSLWCDACFWAEMRLSICGYCFVFGFYT